MAKPERVKAAVQQASDMTVSPFQRILIVGPTGSGKTSQIWTLPGKKFAFIFDPNSAVTLKGCPDLDYVEFLPEFLEMDTGLKGFNKGSPDDKPMGGKKEPLLYENWREWMNDFIDGGDYKAYAWLIFDSHTFLSKAMMDRQLYINGRFGGTEELADYKVVGGKFSDIFSRVNGLPINILATGHLQTYEDEHTKKVVVQLYLPGRARTVLPLSYTNVWEAQAGDKAGTWEIKTLPEKKGLQDIRTSIPGLAPVEDVTIDFRKPLACGIGRLLARSTGNGREGKVRS
jgi:hypothetical protein